jgi:hypothetical protein
MISRLMLNLRDPALVLSGPIRTTRATDTSDYPIVSTLPDSYAGTHFTTNPGWVSHHHDHCDPEAANGDIGDNNNNVLFSHQSIGAFLASYLTFGLFT